MKAWQLETQLMKEAKPVVLDEEEQTWDAIEILEKNEDDKIRLLWSSNVPGSGAPEHVIIAAVQSMENMGYHSKPIIDLIDEGKLAYNNNDMVELNRISSKIFHEIRYLPVDEESPCWKYKKYSSWQEYENSVEFEAPVSYDICTNDYENKILAGWIAQICGGALGTAIEGYTTDKLRETFGEIRYYVRKPNTFNDDITYEIAFLKAFEKKGKKITEIDIAEEWTALIPSGWSAEDIALKNLKLGIYPPMKGPFENPYCEWIGAQMRGAVCGMVAPGNPYEAARLAWMDGVVSHCSNGVLGEIFNAVLTALSFTYEDVKEIIEKAVKLIPEDSEYYSVVSFALNECKTKNDWESAWRECEKKYEEYNWIHAYPNAAAEVIALWFGNGDFDETMHIIAMEGQDVDCNAAQIGTVIGIIKGVNGIDEKWIEPIGDDLDTYIRGMKKTKISKLSEWTVAVTRLSNNR